MIDPASVVLVIPANAKPEQLLGILLDLIRRSGEARIDEAIEKWTTTVTRLKSLDPEVVEKMAELARLIVSHSK